MNLKKQFTKLECDRFREVCNFTPDELEVFELRIQNKSNLEISYRLNISESTVYRRLRNIKRKISKVLAQIVDEKTTVA